MLKPSTLTRAPATGVPEESDTTPLIVPVVACPKARDGATRNVMAHTARSNRVERLIRDIQTSRVVKGKGNNEKCSPPAPFERGGRPAALPDCPTTVWVRRTRWQMGPTEMGSMVVRDDRRDLGGAEV